MPNTAPLGPDIASTPTWPKARQQVEDLQKIDPNFNEFLAFSPSLRARTCRRSRQKTRWIPAPRVTL